MVMSKDYLHGLREGDHFLSPLMQSMIHDGGVSNAFELRDTDPQQLATRICGLFAVPDPVDISETLVRVYAPLGRTGNEMFDKMEFTNSVNMLRKYAAYALGQLGYKASLETLERIRTSDPVPGVREAAGAAFVAISEAPADEGHGEPVRCQIIERVYGA
jgi:hypothetical protein